MVSDLQGSSAAGVPSAAAAPSTLPESAAASPAARTRQRARLPETTALVALLVILVVFFSLTSDFFFSYDNIVNILQNVAVIGIIACPATLLIISGQVDLSVGSVAGFAGILMATAAAPPETAVPFALGLSIPAAFALALLVTLLVGMVNGFAVTVLGLNSLIVTLGTLAIFRGLTKVIGDGQTIRINGFGALGVTRPLFNIPLPVYLFALVTVIFFLVLRYTVYGRAMYAIGASPLAARLAGIRTQWSVFLGFVLSAGCVALAGLIRLSQVGGASPNAGIGFELAVVTAVVLGGASLAGGRGTMLGTVLAVFVVGILNNGLIQLNVPSFWQEVAGGVLLVGAVTFDQLRIRLSGGT